MEQSSELLYNRTRKDISLRGVIHIGAANYEERPDYVEMGIQNVVWIDGHANPSDEMLPNHILIPYYLFDVNGETTLYETAVNSRNDSLFLPTGNQIEVNIKNTRTVPIRRLDSVFAEYNIDVTKYNVMVIDVQGAELKVLGGSGTILDKMDFVVSECWVDSTRTKMKRCYDVQPTIEEMRNVLLQHGLHATTLIYQQTFSGGTRIVTNDFNSIPYDVGVIDMLTERIDR